MKIMLFEVDFFHVFVLKDNNLVWCPLNSAVP